LPLLKFQPSYIRQKQEIYSFLGSDQTKYRTNPASYLMDTGRALLEGERSQGGILTT